MAKIILVGGSKGGVGKSAVSNAVVDALVEAKVNVFLIDSDTSNPDVFKSYSGVLNCESVDLDGKEGWMQLLNIAHDNPDSTVVINTAARNNGGVTAFGKLLMTALPELKRDLVTLWVINRQRDSIELLKQFREHIDVGQLHVVRNIHFGSPSKFELFNDSNTKKDIEKNNGQIIDFPDLADRVADIISNKRMAIGNAAKELDFGERIELQRWRAEAWKALEPVLL